MKKLEDGRPKTAEVKPKKKDKELYFIALVPGEPVFSEVWQLKEEMLDRFETKAALRSPPHITLHMPFKWAAEKEGALFKVLLKLAAGHSPFTLRLNNFGAFEPRVIFVGVEDSAELNKLQKDVTKAAAREWHLYPRPDSRPFRPHMTIAFRDLKKLQFYEAWQEFEKRPYQNLMLVNKICLLKHNGRQWEEYRHFLLKEKVQN